LEYFYEFLQNVIEKSFINWRVPSLAKINTRISETPCMLLMLFKCNMCSIEKFIKLALSFVSIFV
jgi:hypothetical protein